MFFGYCGQRLVFGTSCGITRTIKKLTKNQASQNGEEYGCGK